MILVDSSVLIDLLQHDADWYEWSSNALHTYSQRDGLGINALIYAEIARSFESSQAQNNFLKQTGIQYLDIPAAAAFEANRAHRQYRIAGGTRAATLPDFFIGAHASVVGLSLMTRDAKRITTYFPNVPSISPR